MLVEILLMLILVFFGFLLVVMCFDACNSVCTCGRGESRLGRIVPLHTRLKTKVAVHHPHGDWVGFRKFLPERFRPGPAGTTSRSPGRNLAWEVQSDISNDSSLISNGTEISQTSSDTMLQRSASAPEEGIIGVAKSLKRKMRSAEMQHSSMLAVVEECNIPPLQGGSSDDDGDEDSLSASDNE